MDVCAVLMSPLSRTLQTGTIAFPTATKLYAIENLREECGRDRSDQRSSVSNLRKEFQNADFHNMFSDEEKYWTDERETEKQLE
eukprot:TRINITY_DN4666_c0_g1_i1.p1 TRINITY_DN4666_c0_g1~~TRINITY_DN4666_c0_g1_i1.p1  ORF type:complete len:84 (+),score=20.98 TRINITY_DN4666_c0_g1_i1:114-365(+)